ncbi:MAG: gliding motility-associated protein GldE [Sediminibacterium sp.]
MEFDSVILLNSAGPLLLVLLLLSCSAIMSSSEVAIFSLSPAQRKDLENANDSQSKNVIRLLEHPTPEIATKRLLASVLIGNNMVNIAVVLFSEILFKEWFKGTFLDPWVVGLIKVVGVTTIIVLFGEVIPKVYATANNIKLAKRFAFLFIILDKVFSPVIWILTTAGKWFESDQNHQGGNISVDELGHALELTSDDNRSEEEHRILEGIVTFGDNEVVQIMTPRVDIVCLFLGESFKNIIQRVESSGYSRFVVANEKLDSVSGILYAKDLLPFLEMEEFKWESLQRKPFFVPESKQVDDLLTEFQRDKMHMAIVVDEYGGTSGIVTLQDILQEIVGEVKDEFDDQSEILWSKLDEKNILFVAKIPLIDMYRVYDMDGDDFEASRGDSTTLGGFIVEQMGRIPKRGETWQFGNFEFTIEAADNRKISRVKAKRYV